MAVDVVLALSKGRLQAPVMNLLQAGGVQGLQLPRFVAGTWANCVFNNLNLGILLIRDDDVPTYWLGAQLIRSSGERCFR